MSRLQLWLPSFASDLDHGKYEFLDEEQSDILLPREPPKQQSHARRVFTTSRMLICAALFAGLWAASYIFSQSPGYQDWAPVSGDASFLHLLVPASHGDVNLCKTLYSTSILGYPTPVLINWNKTIHATSFFNDGTHMAKIAGVYEYLQALPESANDDLVLVVDGYDVWFQLRPSVLIERYLDINARANRRIYKQLGRTMGREGIQQTVLFSSQKKCWPQDTGYNPRCYALPESPLAPNVYGPDTDIEGIDPDHPFRRIRQRYLNSGAVIGPRKQLLAVYERAMLRANESLPSDQGIFADILGEQEFQREVIRVRSRSWIAWSHDAFKRLVGTYSSFLESNLADMQPAAGTPFEFGIGIDYASELVQPTVFAELDTAWLARSDKSAILTASASQNITLPQVGPLSRDIMESTPPFALGVQGLPAAETSWEDVPLFTNLFTGISPVAVHHNAWRGGLKSLRESQWNETWFQPYARALLTARAQAPTLPLAQIERGANVGQYGESDGDAIEGDVQEWYGAGYQRAGVDIFGGEVMNWMELCKGTEDEIFRDDGGPWQDPSLDEDDDDDDDIYRRQRRQ